MRQDFDFVEFADYKRDMDELGTQASAVAEALRERVDKARAMLSAAALSAGGEIAIYGGDVMRINMFETTIWRDEANACTRITVKPK